LWVALLQFEAVHPGAGARTLCGHRPPTPHDLKQMPGSDYHATQARQKPTITQPPLPGSPHIETALLLEPAVRPCRFFVAQVGPPMFFGGRPEGFRLEFNTAPCSPLAIPESGASFRGRLDRGISPVRPQPYIAESRYFFTVVSKIGAVLRYQTNESPVSWTLHNLKSTMIPVTQFAVPPITHKRPVPPPAAYFFGLRTNRPV
jgi:hypothetical protein